MRDIEAAAHADDAGSLNDLEPIVKGHEAFVEQGVNNLVALTILENPLRGLALRTLVTKSDEHVLITFGKIAMKARWQRSSGLGKATISPEAMNAISHLPDGSTIREGFRHKLATAS